MTVSYVVSGFAVGLLVGLTGVGGGSLMTPLLTLLFGIHPSVAVGTVGLAADAAIGTVRITGKAVGAAADVAELILDVMSELVRDHVLLCERSGAGTETVDE